MLKLTSMIMASVLLGVSAPSFALLITASSISTEDLGDFEADVNWSGSDLTVSLTNTSVSSNGGYISGFLMRLPGGATFNVGWTDSNLTLLPVSSGPYAGSPYGDFDYGFAINGNFLGGGKPSNGIGVGETGQFIFSDWNLGLDLTTEDFIANYATADESDTNFLVRFRGFDDDGSDKVIGMYGEIPDLPPPPTSSEIPEPNIFWLMLLGLGAFLLRKKALLSTENTHYCR